MYYYAKANFCQGRLISICTLCNPIQPYYWGHLDSNLKNGIIFHYIYMVMINCTCSFDSRVTVGLNCVYWVDEIVLVRPRFKLPFQKKTFLKLSRSNENDRMWIKKLLSYGLIRREWIDFDFQIILPILMFSLQSNFKAHCISFKILFKIDTLFLINQWNPIKRCP